MGWCFYPYSLVLHIILLVNDAITSLLLLAFSIVDVVNPDHIVASSIPNNAISQYFLNGTGIGSIVMGAISAIFAVATLAGMIYFAVNGGNATGPAPQEKPEIAVVAQDPYDDYPNYGGRRRCCRRLCACFGGGMGGGGAAPTAGGGNSKGSNFISKRAPPSSPAGKRRFGIIQTVGAGFTILILIPFAVLDMITYEIILQYLGLGEWYLLAMFITKCELICEKIIFIALMISYIGEQVEAMEGDDAAGGVNA